MLLGFPTPAEFATVPALAGPVKVGLGLLAALLIIVPVRALGRFLIRKGGAMERAKHGVVPGAGSEPPRRDNTRRDAEDASPQPERYDPFSAD